MTLRLSLRTAVGALLAGVFGLLLALSMALVVYNARQAVAEELASVGRLSARLLGDVLPAMRSAALEPGQLARIAALDDAPEVRHLCITVQDPAGDDLLPGDGCRRTVARDAPDWFAALLQPSQPMEFRRQVALGSTQAVVVVRAEAGDEIDEVWRDTRSVLASILAVALVAGGGVFFGLRSVTAPLDRVMAGLRGIESGDYRCRLAGSRLAEFSAMASIFNHMAATLERSTAETRRLARLNLRIQEDERRRLARELHDELGQSLSAIQAHAELIREAGAERPAGRQAAAIRGIAAEVLGQVRQMIRRLHPVMLEELGLAATLRQLVHQLAQRNPRLRVRLGLRGPVDPIAPDRAIQVYRVIQEALTNVERHARAGRVRVCLVQRLDGRLGLRVRDDGCGFEPRHTPRGLGLAGMEERIRALDGELRVTSRPGAGTLMEACLPAPPATDRTPP